MGKQKTKEKKKKSTIKWNFKLHIALTIIFFAAVGYLVYLARTNPKVFSAKGTG